ncbi:MAG: GAF domain-containing protein, partial [Anaerolineales bacterium]
VEAQLTELGGEYRALVAGARVPVSYLGVPLVLGGQVIGVLAVEDDQQVGKFGQSQAFILKTIAAPIAVAIDNARLQVERQARAAELVERVRQLALLNRLSSGLMGMLDVPPILRLVLDELQAAVPLDHASVLLLEPEPAGGEHRIALAEPAGSALPDSEALAGMVSALRQANGGAVALPAAEAVIGPEHLTWLAPEGGPRLLLPLSAEGRLAGVVALARTRGGPAFSVAEIELALTAVNQAGLAIASARQYAGARQATAASHTQAVRFDRLAEASGALAAADTTPAVLSVIQDQLAAALPADSLSIYEVEADGAGTPAWLRVLAERGYAGAARQAVDLARNPLLSETIAAATPQLVDDTHTDSRFAGPGAAHLPAARAWLVVPLTAQGRVTWLLLAQKLEAGAYQPGHLALALALAGPMAAALENARQHDAMRQRATLLETEMQRLGVLKQAADDILRAGELPEVVRRTLAAMLQSSGGEQACALLFADAAAGQPEPLFVQHPRANALGGPNIAGNPLLERFQHPETRTPIVITDAAGERIKASFLTWIAPEVQSAAILPLVLDDAWIGVVGVAHSQPNGLRPDGLAVLTPLAQQLASAVANGRRQSQLSSTLQEQSALNALSRALNQAADLDQVEATVSASIGSLFGVSHWYLALLNPEATQVAFRPFVEAGQARPMAPHAPEGVIHHILVTRRPLLLSGDIGSQLRELSLPNRGNRARPEAGDPSGAMAFLGVPLLAGDEPLGMIALEDRRSAGAFGDDRARLLAALAAQLAAAVLRLRAQEQMQQATQRVAELTALYEQSSQAMQAAQQELHERTASLAEVQARSEQASGEAERFQAR